MNEFRDPVAKRLRNHNKRVQKLAEKLDAGAKTCGRCVACARQLGIPGGMAGTGLCGPCCTGEAATLEEFAQTW